jgi:hypothetical protein
MFMSTIAKRFAITLVICSLGLAVDQTTNRQHFLAQARIEQKDGHVSLLANSPRALDQAIGAIRHEYGWIVDYEDPPYGLPDLVDDTDRGWRKAHPNAKGVTRVAGGIFKTDFFLSSNVEMSSTDQERVLNQIVDDYKASGNPGDFTLRRESANRYAIVGIGVKNNDGTEKKVVPILDIGVTLPLEERTVGQALQLIAQALSRLSGYRVVLASAPTNMILQTKLKNGGTEKPARELLAQLAMATRFPMVWRLLYDADGGWYFINLEIAAQTATDSSDNPNIR